MNYIITSTFTATKILFLLLFLLTPKLHSESIEKNVSIISNELMCPVCRGQTVAESNSSLANDFREIIRKKLEAGESKEEILNYFIGRYGESVLASPPARGIRLIVWIAPLLAIIIGFFILIKFIKSKNVKIENNESIPRDKDQYLEKVDNKIKDLKL
ncbi:MAG: cytochrome c-type biogenesis protein [Thermodesulfobacteriota bacterium]